MLVSGAERSVEGDWLHAISMGEAWNTPAPTKNVPAYFTALRSDVKSMMYPQIPTTVPAAMKGPLTLTLSDRYAVKITTRNPSMLGGAVRSCAVVDL